MPKERNKADGYREKAYEGDTKAMNNLVGIVADSQLTSAGIPVGVHYAFHLFHLSPHVLLIVTAAQ